ncbi:MAG TPA: peptidoglycan DD-metalloendopeptidase family protein, partial [Vicinamibacteria bacterium]|nr:peptidoglycan DD-metalloendopeptidase family protein [Vicinamibacteria bacterium]
MKKTKRWRMTLAFGLLWLPVAALGAESPRTAEEAGVEQLADQAVEASNAGRSAEALQLWRQLELSSDRSLAWAGVSGQVIVNRMIGDGDAARAVTQRIAAARPDLAGLMALWDADTAMVEKDLQRALAEYRRAADVHGAQVVDGRPIGVAALRQLARAHLENQDAAKAAETERELARRFPRFVDRDEALGRILAFEAMAAGGLPLKPLEKLVHDGDCSADQPCVLGRAGQVRRGPPPADARPLAGRQGLFVLAEAEAAEELPSAPVEPLQATEPPSPLACVPTMTSSGYTQPMNGQRGGGYDFMTTPDASGGWHTGIDLNRGAAQEDCNDPIYAAADGCVMDVMASNTDWGSAAIEHLSPPALVTSQYGHAYAVYVSIGQFVRKGHLIGKVGGTGSGGPNHFACHLHFEIREGDHADRNNAGSYRNGSQAVVGDEYQNPLPFITAHKAYTDVVARDEETFTFTPSASWTTAAVGDNDDMRWALTTPVSPKTTYARHTLTVPTAGTWELWAFIPYTNRTSTAVPYSLTRISDGVVMFSATINQGNKNDAWERIGSAALATGVQYRIEVATNTGEANARVAVDDFRLIRLNQAARANLYVSDLTFSLPPAIGVATTATATLRNTGTVASGGFNIKWFVDDLTDNSPPVQVGYGFHDSLAAGATSNGNVRFNWTPAQCFDPPCTYSVEYVADVDGQVLEGNETDNSFRRQMAVYPPACPAPSATTPGSATVCSGNSHMFSTTPSGGNGTFSYQWNTYNCTGGCSWKPVGTNSPNFTTNQVAPYNVTVTSCNQSFTTGTFNLANFPAVATTNPGSTTVCPGYSHTFQTTASGGNGSYVYQWQEWNCTNGCSWKPVGTNSRYFTTNLVRTYNLLVSSCGQTVGSGYFTLANYAALATTTPASVYLCPGTPHTFSVTASGGTGTYSYQWEEWNCTNGCSWKPVGTNSRFFTTSLARSYRVKVTSCSTTVMSNIFTLTNPPALATTTPQSWVTLPGFFHTFTTTTTGGTGAYTYQWY